MCPKRSGEVPISKVSIEEYRPYVDTDQYPLEFVEKHALLKLKEDDRLVSVGVCGPLNTGLLEDLKNFHRKQIRCFRIDRSDLSAWMGEKMSDISEDRNLEEIFLTHGESILIDKLAPDAPTVNLVNSILIDGIRKEASDIHIEVDGEETLVRYRIDGYLHIMHRFGRERFREVSSRIKIMANLNIVERRLPQDGRITVHLDSDLFDLRVSIVPIVGGESIVLRLFNKKRTPLEIDQLGLSSGSLRQIKSLFRKTQGLVLVTGPTGSGKTTTLNAILREIRSESTKIITIEDPVEYITDGIDQIQTNEKIGLTFDSILKRVLRQDPNIIMVGEIRDMPTAELSVRAALTGHLVFSTLHTKDSVSVITRLKNMGIESYLIGAVLKGAVAQRLVRKICPGCKEAIKPEKTDRDLLRRYGLSAERLYRGAGCKKCSGTGFRGRTGIFELYISDDELEEMILKEGRESEIRNSLVSKGMKRLIRDGLEKAVRGVTTIDEVDRVVEE